MSMLELKAAIAYYRRRRTAVMKYWCGCLSRLVQKGNTTTLYRECIVRNQEYVILGDCYLHGITQGEAVKGHEHERRTITLY
jgi:hypothetical protein